MSTAAEMLLSVVMVVVIVVGLVLLGGEPDIADAIRKYIDAKTMQLECEHANTK
jgi:hypothetical protein